MKTRSTALRLPGFLMVLPVVGTLFTSLLAGAQPSGTSQPGKPIPKPRWVLVRDWADEHSNLKTSEGGSVATRSKRALTVTNSSRGAFACRYEYDYSYTGPDRPRTRVDEILGNKKVSPKRILATVVRSHTWTVPPAELLPGDRLVLEATVKADGSTYSVDPPKADDGYYKSMTTSGGETGLLVRLAPPPRDPSSSYSGNTVQPREIGRVQAILGRPAPRAEIVIPEKSTLYPYLEFVAWCASSQIEENHVHTFRYEWRDRPLIEPPCAEARYFYTPQEMSQLYSGTVPPLYHSREQLVAQLVNALKTYETEAAARKEYPVPYAPHQTPESDAPKLVAAFYTGASPTGKEDALRSAIAAEYRDTGRRLEPERVFLHALRTAKGNIRDAMVTAHAILYRNGDGPANTNKVFVETYLVPMRNPDAYNKTDKLFQRGKDAQNNPILVTPHAVLADDQQGPWYHFFGTAAVEFQDRAALTPFAVQRFGIEHVAAWLKVQPPHVDAMKGVKIPSELGTELSNYCLMLENLVRSRGGSAPDPDKQCVNYSGVAAGIALQQYVRSRRSAWEDAAQRKFDEGLGVSGGTPALGAPVDPTWNPSQGGVSVVTKSPVSLKITGSAGQEFHFDQAARKFGGNTNRVLVEVLPETDGTWGIVATPLFAVKTIELVGTRAGDATIGVYRYADHKVNSGKIVVAPGERYVLDQPQAGALPALPTRVLGGATVTPTPPVPGSTAPGAGQEIRLQSPSSGAILARTYPRRNLRIDLTLTYSKPGTVFDTVGINAAPVGSFNLQVAADGRLAFNVYDPGRSSASRAENGWHSLPSRRFFPSGQPHRVAVELSDGRITLRVNGEEEAALALATPLSGETLYAGDFPGDDHWGANNSIHPGMVGTITGIEVTALRKDAGAAKSRSPLVIDRTGSVSGEELKAVAEALTQLRAQRGIAAAVLFLGDSTDDQIRSLSTDTRLALIRDKELPSQSGVLVLFTRGEERHLWWHRDRSLDARLPSETVMGTWRAIPANESFGGAALRLLQSLQAAARGTQ